MTLTGEEVDILNLIQNTKQRTLGAKGGEIVMCSSNKFLTKEYYYAVKKSSDYAKEAGGVIEATQ